MAGEQRDKKGQPAKRAAKPTRGQTRGQAPSAPSARTTPTMRDLASLIGRQGWWNTDDLAIKVQITDARAAFGRVDVAISPVDGRGEKWVDLASISVDDAAASNHR